MVETAASRVLKMKFACGLFDRPMTDPSLLPMVNSAAHQALALRAAEEGVVLLKNEGGLLPIGPSITRIAVIGPNGGCASDTPPSACDGIRSNYLGSYTQWKGGTTVVKTVAEALSDATAGQPGTSVTFAQGAAIDTYDLSMIPAAYSGLGLWFLGLIRLEI